MPAYKKPKPFSSVNEPEARPPRREPEVTLYGVHACMACYEKRPDQIVRAFFNEDIVRLFGGTMKHLAAAKRPYRVVPNDELEKISGTRHHEGVCFVVNARNTVSLQAYLELQAPMPVACPVALEGVGNPHNMGAVMRVCAQFGSSGLVVDCTTGLDSGAAARVAQGGAEWVDVVPISKLKDAVYRFREAGYSVCATSSHHGTDIFTTKLPKKCLFLLGEEARGLSRSLFDKADLCLRIPGTDKVESLNVACASSVLLGEFWRQHHGQLAPLDIDGPDPFGG